MKQKLQTLLKHKLQWLMLLAALLGVSQGVFGDNEFNKDFLYIDCNSFHSYTDNGVNVKRYWDTDCTNKQGEYYHLSTLSNDSYVHYDNLTGIGSYTYLRGFMVSQGDWHDDAKMGVVNNSSNNCIRVTNWGTYSWTTYVQKPNYTGLTVTNANSGSGTSADPYIVYTNTSFTLSSSASLPQSDDSKMSIRYYHGDSSSGNATETSSTKSITSSSTAGVKTQYYGRVRGYYSEGSNNYSSYADNRSVYVQTVFPDYYLAGDSWIGSWSTTDNANKMSINSSDPDYSTIPSKTIQNVSAGDHLFKVSTYNWGSSVNCKATIDISGLVSGDTKGCDGSNDNIKLSLAGTRDVTVAYDGATLYIRTIVPCTSPTQQDVYIGSSGTTSKSLSICSDGSTSIWLNASEEGYSYQLKKQNGASWGDVGEAWSNESSGTGGHEFSGITAAANYKIIGYPTSDGSSSSCAIDMLNLVTLSHYDDMALSDVSIDASSVCKSGTTTIRTSGANIGGTGVVNYSSSNTSIVSVSDKTIASATLTGGSTAGEATITVSISGGCGTAPASKTATLTVNPDTDLSGATISFTPSATCNGNGSVASISDAQLGGGTGAWSWESGTGKGSINATTGLISGVTTATTGSHTFRYTVTGGCGSNGKTKDENVTLGYSPIVSPITKTVKAYEPVSLTCTNANVTWAVNGGETPTHYIYDSSKRSTKFKAAPGTYMVTATNATMTCPGSATVIVEADDDCTPVP